jgi:hypothetical protein
MLILIIRIIPPQGITGQKLPKAIRRKSATPRILLFLQPISTEYRPAQGPTFNLDRPLVESVCHDFQVQVFNLETQMKELRRPL